MRFLPMALILGGLSACAPAVPDSAAGVGFSSIEAQRAREAALSGTATMPGVAAPTAVSSAPLSAAGTVSTQPQIQTASAAATLTGGGDSMATRGDSASDIAAETAAALRAAQSNSGEMPVQASPLNPAPAMINNAGISDENDFQAVANRETIQSDADRMARNRQMYQEIEPTAVPRRPGDDQPNIVAYALQSNNPRGAQLYSRSGLNLQGRHARNCAKYGSADLAQMAFLSKGGPKRDRMALDPDGDGYACAWDPAPFREAVKN